MTQIDVDTAELAVLQHAVENYRRTKGAERLLKCVGHPERYPQYDALVAIIKKVQEKVGTPT